MPYPFQPIIGSNFDSVGAQARSWAGFNADVENANLARQAQAQREQNNYLQTVSQLQQQAMDRDAAAAAAVQQENYRRGQDAVSQARWAAEFQAGKEQFAQSKAAETARTKVMDAQEKFREKVLAAQQTADQDAIDRTGNYYAATYPKIAKTYNNERQQFEMLQGEQQSFQNTVDELKTKMSTGQKLSDEETKKLMEAQKILATINLRVRSADRHDSPYKQAEAAYNALEKSMARDGYAPDMETGSIRHSSGKVFNFKDAVAKAAGTPATAATGTTPAAAPQGWAGFQGTNTVTTPAPAAPVQTVTDQGINPRLWNRAMHSSQMNPSAARRWVRAYYREHPEDNPDAVATAPSTNAPTKVWVRGPDGRLILQQ